jgi:hypothetical protein
MLRQINNIDEVMIMKRNKKTRGPAQVKQEVQHEERSSTQCHNGSIFTETRPPLVLHLHFITAHTTQHLHFTFQPSQEA